MVGPTARFLVAFTIAALAAAPLSGCIDETTPVPVAQRETPALSVEQSAQIEDGRMVADMNCASCHAVGREGDSPNPRAPLFRTVLSRYNADMLATELIVGVRVSHAPMPQFQFNPATADSLIAYLRSVQTSKPGRKLAEQRCARCHAIGNTDTSPYPGALALRKLGQRWRRDQLRDALHTGIIVEHDKADARVPMMKLNDADIDALFTFLDSIATAENPAPKWR